MANPLLSMPDPAGQRIGLYGGSFNPAHEGHFAVSLFALNRLRLDWVWWLVSPQNPLKDPKETDGFASRLAAARSIARHPRFVVSDVEGRLGTRTTAGTLRAMEPLLKRGRFVWIMGADSFAGLDRWNDWREIPARLPLAVCDRPGWTMAALNSPAARHLWRYRLAQEFAASLPDSRPPAWTFLTQRHWEVSSTEIRARSLSGVVSPSSASS
jgi:nicotinate-nucleotide adenylyltransferase